MPAVMARMPVTIERCLHAVGQGQRHEPDRRESGAEQCEAVSGLWRDGAAGQGRDDGELGG